MSYPHRFRFLFSVLLVASISCSGGSTTDDSAESSNRNVTPGSCQTGCVEGDCQEGKGTFVYPNCDKYAGSFKAGERSGNGTFTYDNGDRYVGEFAGDLRNGVGSYFFVNGDMYVGGFKDGVRSGKGIYTFKGGDVFDGEFQNDGESGTGNLKVDTTLKTCELKGKAILCDKS